MTGSYTTNTIHNYQFDGDDAAEKMQLILKMFRFGFKEIGGLRAETVLDYSRGLDGLPESDVVQYRLAGGSVVMLKPSGGTGAVPGLTVYISATGNSEEDVAALEKRISEDLDGIIFMDSRMGYCCE